VTLGEGDWGIDSKASHLAYVSIKAGEIAEANRFDSVTGSVTAEGTARVEVALASVNTGVEIRDQRMREIFFEVADFPSAVITAKLDPAKFASLEVGKAMVQPITAKLELKGMQADVDARVQIARVSEDRVIATTTQPIIITTDMFGLTDELGELRALAQLPSISPAVPVTFTLAFQRSS
jgi:polyisoprenoid-binding protein YceI